MTDRVVAIVLGLGPVLVGGCLLGIAFYGSLWWTVRRGLPSSRPARWFLGGMALRTALALVAIYLLGDGHWERLATCLLGFVLARPLVLRWSRRTGIRLDGRPT